MKKILVAIFWGLFSFYVQATEYAPIANLEYIHSAISNKYDITVPYNPNVADVGLAANMKYLLTAIDVANRMQGVSTSYGDSEFATEYAANTITVDTALDTLIYVQTGPNYEGIDTEFPFAITTDTIDSFSFQISAKGDFVVDWGDGTVEPIPRTDTTLETIPHTYDTAGEYTIRIGGVATGYSSSATTPAISFASNSKIIGISGSLGFVFPTLPDKTQPSFYQTFYYNYNLSGALPKYLFAKVSGAPAGSMFYKTFYNCSKIEELPEGLFGELDGVPASSMFYQTFFNCNKLKSIPKKLFGNLYGRPAISMFYGTFQECTGLTGQIPLGLFGGFENYYRTSMFGYTFYNCSGLTGPSARMPDGTFLYDYFTTGSGYYQMSKMYYNCTGLSDYADIPAASK